MSDYLRRSADWAARVDRAAHRERPVAVRRRPRDGRPGRAAHPRAAARRRRWRRLLELPADARLRRLAGRALGRSASLSSHPDCRSWPSSSQRRTPRPGGPAGRPGGRAGTDDPARCPRRRLARGRRSRPRQPLGRWQRALPRLVPGAAEGDVAAARCAAGGLGRPPAQGAAGRVGREPSAGARLPLPGKAATRSSSAGRYASSSRGRCTHHSANSRARPSSAKRTSQMLA